MKELQRIKHGWSADRRALLGQRINRSSYWAGESTASFTSDSDPESSQLQPLASSPTQAHGAGALLGGRTARPSPHRRRCSGRPGWLVCFWHRTLTPWQPHFCLGQNDIMCICLKTVLQKAEKIHIREKFMSGLKVKHDLAAKQQRRQHSDLRFRKSHPKFSQRAVFSPVTQLQMSTKHFVIFSLAPTWKTKSWSSRLCYTFANTISWGIFITYYKLVMK